MGLVCAVCVAFSHLAGAAEPNAAGTTKTRAGTSAAFDAAECFDKVWQGVHEQFWDPNFNGVNWEEAARRYKPKALAAADHEAFAVIVNQMLGELRTSHTRYLTRWDPDYYTLQAALISQMLAAYGTSDPAVLEKYAPGQYSSQGRPHRVGIGVVTRQIDGRHYVSRVLVSSPADKAGVLSGDLLLQVDGEPFHPIRSFEGKAGRQVELILQRGSSESTRRAVRTDARRSRGDGTLSRRIRRPGRGTSRTRAIASYTCRCGGSAAGRCGRYSTGPAIWPVNRRA